MLSLQPNPNQPISPEGEGGNVRCRGTNSSVTVLEAFFREELETDG